MTSFLRPREFAKQLGLGADDRSGEIEIRAQYGGFFLAAGIAHILPIFAVTPYLPAFAISLVIFSGLFIGRIAAFFFGDRNHPINFTVTALFFIDGIGAVMAAGGLHLSV